MQERAIVSLPYSGLDNLDWTENLALSVIVCPPVQSSGLLRLKVVYLKGGLGDLCFC
jgi:hypothetical protein